MKSAIPLFVVAALFLTSACERSTTKVEPITPAELAKRIEKGTAPIILDVRTREEYAAGHIPGAVNIPHDQLAERLDRVPSTKSEEIVVHCERGRRAANAEETLAAAGYTNLYDLTGHMQAWQEQGLPVE